MLGIENILVEFIYKDNSCCKDRCRKHSGNPAGGRSAPSCIQGTHIFFPWSVEGEQRQRFQVDELTDMHPPLPPLLVCVWRRKAKGTAGVALTKHLCFHDEAAGARAE